MLFSSTTRFPQQARIIARRALALVTWAVLALLTCSVSSQAQDTSAPAILQFFEARYDTIEDRQVDLFYSGYGAMWLPPPSRADSGNQSVGYDVFDRFDLGSPRNETLYGTKEGLKTLIDSAHNASVNVYTDLILNHNGFSDQGTFDNQGTPETEDDVTFEESGGYPGFVLSLPGDVDGDFHGAFEGGDINGRLSGLIDIAQEKNHQFIRHPIDPSNPNNIPAGTAGIFNRPPANVPDPSNAQFYPDQGLGGVQIDVDPGPGEFLVTRYDFNTTDPLQGDPVMENAEQLTLRHVQWMVQEIGVDGFRIDAAKHFPTNTLTLMDQAVFRASNQTNLDGSIKPIFSFSEVLDGNTGFVQSFIDKSLTNPNAIDTADFEVKGNRDALDFPLSFALRSNLTDNGFANNWHSIRSASQDNHDDGLTNGSAGVMFVNNHDDQNGGLTPGDGTPFLDKVAHAYILMRPGNAVVYFNAEEFGTAEFRNFPTHGTDDSLGGPVSGDAVSKLVGIRNTHGRGNFHERWIDDAFNPNGFSNIYIYERENSAIVGLNSRNDAFVETRNGVQTGFAPGTILVELTGNAENELVDPAATDAIPQTVKVNGSGQVNISIPSNDTQGLGYVVYGLPKPEGTLSLTNVASTLAGGTPTALTNGTVRQGDIDVIHSNSFDVTLNTNPVSVIDPDTGLPVRDFDADADEALIRVNQGMDLNNIAGIDNPTPGSISEGFESFTDVRTPGYIDDGSGSNNIGTGSGTYTQTIDATQLPEGRNFITVRAFRHRNSATGGDGGPAVYEDFKRVVYVDLLPPEAALVSFDPFASEPNDLENRDLIVRSTDKTANNMHLFLDLPANLTDAQVLQMALNGQNDAGEYDRDQWIFGFNDVTTGNHVATIVTFEESFNGVNGFNVQRFSTQMNPELFTATGIGLGFGDMDADDAFEIADLAGIGNDSFEDVLYSQNAKFNAAADVDGDGNIDNHDLFALGDQLISAGANQSILDSYNEVLLRRGDLNGDMKTDSADVDHLYANFGSTGWLEDLNVDGIVDALDVQTLINDIVGTTFADFNLSGTTDGGDYLTLLRNFGTISSAQFNQGNSDFDLDIDATDIANWQELFGGAGSVLAAATTVPEPTTLGLSAFLLACTTTFRFRNKQRRGK